MTEKRRAPLEVLERLAEAADAWYGGTAPDDLQPGWCEESKAMFGAMAAYRAAVAPLRTRAVVDAEIAAVLRAWPGLHNGLPRVRGGWHLNDEISDKLRALCSEPTAPNSGPSSADTEEVPSPRPPVSPAGADYSLELNLGAYRSKCIRSDYEALHTGDTRYCRECLSKPCRWWGGWRPSGPAGVAAAKESRDNAAAPEGATKVESHACNPDVEPCGCEHTEALLTRLRRIHRICDCYASIDGDRQLEIWTLSNA